VADRFAKLALVERLWLGGFVGVRHRIAQLDICLIIENDPDQCQLKKTPLRNDL
jgi:hypothetical protein